MAAEEPAGPPPTTRISVWLAVCLAVCSGGTFIAGAEFIMARSGKRVVTQASRTPSGLARSCAPWPAPLNPRARAPLVPGPSGRVSARHGLFDLDGVLLDRRADLFGALLDGGSRGL